MEFRQGNKTSQPVQGAAHREAREGEAAEESKSDPKQPKQKSVKFADTAMDNEGKTQYKKKLLGNDSSEAGSCQTKTKPEGATPVTQHKEQP